MSLAPTGHVKEGRSDFLHLARRCESLDRARAQVFFLNPEKVHDIMDDLGIIDWGKVSREHFRTTIFYQYKSILKHAGILAPTAMGGASTKGYKPEEDVWELAER